MSWKPTRRSLGGTTLAGAATLLSLGRAGVAAAHWEAAQPGTALAQATEETAIDDAVETPVDAPAEAVLPIAADPPAISPLEIVTLALVNGARAARNIPPLEWDATMAEVARAHARDMMTRGVVSHTGADGSSPVARLRRAGVQFQFGSENIWTYWGRVADQGPATMHSAMMAEPWRPGLWNHIANILYTGYRRIGIGIVSNPNGVQYLSEVFAD